VRRNKKGGKAWALFIDLKSAFDKVNHDYLFEKMEELKIDKTITNTIKWLYQVARIEVGDEEVEVGSGVL